MSYFNACLPTFARVPDGSGLSLTRASFDPLTPDAFAALGNQEDLQRVYSTAAEIKMRGYEDGAEYVFPVDYGFDCATSIMRPLAADSKSDTEHWFIYGGSDGKITRNGRSNTEVFTYDRYGVKFSATALSGLISFGDDHNEKRIRGYIPMLLCSSSRMGVTVSLYGANKANKAPEFLESQTFDTDQDPAVAPFFQQQNYFQFKLVAIFAGASSGRPMPAIHDSRRALDI